MSDDVRAEIDQIERDIAQAVRDGEERWRAIDEQRAHCIAASQAQHDAIEVKIDALNTKIRRMTAPVALISPARGGAQWKPQGGKA